MKKTDTIKRTDRRSCLPIRWDEMPHDELLKKVVFAMEFGSLARSSKDALMHMLKRRLPNLDSVDHRRYVELGCQRIVEMLRMARDQYRLYLEDKGCKSIAEVYWVVFRFAVIPYAVRVLRTAASEYVLNSQIHAEDCQLLFGYPNPRTVVPLGPAPIFKTVFEDNSRELVEKTISGLVCEKTFTRLMTGGPFGRDGQILIARDRLDMNSRLSINEDIKLRQELWDKCRPWTDGLATMFDVSQEEIFFQSESLPEDGRRAETVHLSLTECERTAYLHIADIGGRRTSRTLGERGWRNLLRELDEKQVSLDSELKGKPKRVLDEVRKRGHQIDTWSQCYDSRLRISVGGGKTYSLRREVTHFLHNVSKNAARQFGKIWKL